VPDNPLTSANQYNPSTPFKPLRKVEPKQSGQEEVTEVTVRLPF
jgi:hypothetical protein